VRILRDLKNKFWWTFKEYLTVHHIFLSNCLLESDVLQKISGCLQKQKQKRDQTRDLWYEYLELEPTIT